MNYNFSINQDSKIQEIRVGEEQYLVIIIDDFLNNPSDILKYATQGLAFFSQEDDFYPGIKKALAVDYANNVADFCNLQLLKKFKDITGKNLAVNVCDLSITTTYPEDLLPIQCIPHFDTADSNQLAIVHYLFKSPLGGTSFYRHRYTGFESIDKQRFRSYTTTLEREATTVGFPKTQYINSDSVLFKRIASIEAKFNRAIFYHSNVLHSGDIQIYDDLSADPLTGRLTATNFFDLRINCT